MSDKFRTRGDMMANIREYRSGLATPFPESEIEDLLEPNPKFDLNSIEAVKQVREMIGRKSLDAIATFTKRVGDGGIPMSVAYECITLLVEAVYPASHPTFQATLSDLQEQWKIVAEEDARQRAIEEKRREEDRYTEVLYEKAKSGELKLGEEFSF